MDPLYGSTGRNGSGNYPIFSSGAGSAGGLDEAVTHRKQGSLSPGSHAELGVDVLEMSGYCLAADVQLGGDLGVGAALAEAQKHLGLARGQARRQARPAPGLVAGGREHRLDRISVEPPSPHFVAHGSLGLTGVERRTVRTRLAEGVVDIGRAENPGRQ